ncbi:AraC family transcriptional regulator [Sphingomonas sp. QA11]|uniref:helix-turn-helix transcriptional regulator n=1 Tax=Sphingomonas sp. QA11 TaxID=2950605 RepID=UPI002349A798|nr:AraC family transcriptional regulator [Sphingomonas sp. QA11]WCM28557.1 AraC family transcriptional regulator [Sphingomonas sp. QA11]
MIDSPLRSGINCSDPGFKGRIAADRAGIEAYAAADGDVHRLSHARLNRVLAYVDARLGDKLSVVDLAAVAGMDPSGFTRALRARTGLAPYAWLTGLRMTRAAQLIASGMPITQAASHVGYCNAGKFAAAFRRTLGYLPSAAAA